MVPSNTRRLTFVVLSKKSLTSELIVITFGTDIHVPWTSWYCFTRRGIVGFLGCGLVLRTVEPLTVHILVLSESCSLFEQHIIFHSGYRCGLQCLFYWERYSGVSVKDTAHGTWAGLEWCGSLSCLCVGPTGLPLICLYIQRAEIAWLFFLFITFSHIHIVFEMGFNICYYTTHALWVCDYQGHQRKLITIFFVSVCWIEIATSSPQPEPLIPSGMPWVPSRPESRVEGSCGYFNLTWEKVCSGPLGKDE